MKILTYHVTLLEPALVTALGGEPNGALAFNYLPGSVLRGALMASYVRDQRKCQPLYELDAAATDVRQLFFDGHTRYLNGYLEHDGYRTLPAPASWQRDKEDENGPLHDFALDDPSDKKSWKGLDTRDFVFVREDVVRVLQPERQVAIHTARNRRLGRPQERVRVRPDEDPGAVYRYEALAPGQTFAAAIVCDNDSHAAILLDLLPGEIRLGGARTGGYGRAIVQDVQEPAADWCEVGTAVQERGSDMLIVTLLSDTLIRDENGQFTADPEVLCQVLGDRLETGPLKRSGAFVRSQVTGGFNRKWGLPLPQTLAIGMGSVFVCTGSSCPPDRLQKLEAQGVGERRAEGFGRVAVNWQAQTKLSREECPSASASAPPPLGTDGPGENLARRMVERMLRTRLDARVTAAADPLGKRIRHPSKSQLARLRLVLHDALQQTPSQGRSRLGQYLDDLARKSSVRKEFSRDRLENRPLLEWLGRRINDGAGEIWKVLGAEPLPVVGGIKPTLTAELIYEYNLRLIDAVLARAAKERRKEDV